MSFVRFALGRLAFPLISLAFMVVYWAATRDLKAKVTNFPYMFVAIGIALFGWILVTEAVAWTRARRGSASQDKPGQGTAARWGVFAGITAYIVLMPYVGFLTTSGLFMVGLMWFLGERRPLRLAVVTAGTIAICWLFFREWLHVPLPEGFLL